MISLSLSLSVDGVRGRLLGLTAAGTDVFSTDPIGVGTSALLSFLTESLRVSGALIGLAGCVGAEPLTSKSRAMISKSVLILWYYGDELLTHSA